MLDFSHSDWRPPVKMVVAVDNKGVVELFEAIEAHRQYMSENGGFLRRRTENAKIELIEMVKASVIEKLLNHEVRAERVAQLAELVANREKDPYTAVEELVASVF
jgi:LAO/AO transport system kinase